MQSIEALAGCSLLTGSEPEGHRRLAERVGDNLPTEIVKIPDRGYSITIYHDWREVADKSLEFVQRFLTIPEMTASGLLLLYLTLDQGLD